MADQNYDFLTRPVVVNPLGAIDSGLRAANALNLNRAVQARQLAGQAMMSGVDAQGVYHPDRGNLALQQAGPGAALAAQQTLESNQSLSDAQLAQARTRFGAINSVAGGLLDLPNPTQGDAITGMHDLMTTGIITPAQFQAEVANLPTDPGAIKQWAAQHQQRALSAQAQIDSVYPRAGTMIGPSGETIGTQQQPGRKGGALSPASGSGISTGLTPEQLTTQVEGPPDASGAPTKETLADRFRRQGIADQVPGMPEYNAKHPQGGVAGLPASLRNPANAAPPAPAQPAAASATPAPVAAPTGGTPAVTGQAPAVLEQQRQNAAASAANFSAEPKNDQTAQTQLAMLSNMQSDLGRFTSGAGAERTLDFKRALQSWAPSISAATGIKSDTIASQESFDKLANQIALTQANAGSDQRMATSLAANPHAGLSPEGADMIIRQLQGNADFIRAKASLAAKYKDRTDYVGFQNSTAALDPRVFQYDRMKEDQAHSWYMALPKDQKVPFQQAYAATHRLMGLPVPGGL